MYKIDELIMTSCDIHYRTLCVDSPCFLTPVGGSLPLLVLLCFCSPSVSSVGICTAARVEAEQKKRGESFPELTSVMALQFSSSAKRQQSCLSEVGSWHGAPIITAMLVM